METFKITLAYDGTGFVGWQRQAAGTSIQGLLEEVLAKLDQRAVSVAGAGRTDAGVHALGQVASFTLQRSIRSEALVRALNGCLPEAIRVIAAECVADTFHARFAATGKTYRYRIWNARVASPFERAYTWHVVEPLDRRAMADAAVLLEGPHDFAAFKAAGGATRSTEREVFSSRISAGLPPGGPASIAYEIAGTGFLHHMVRTIVGTLVEIGRGRRPVEWMADVLAGRDRTRAGATAPAHGLALVEVAYGARSLAARR
ncbi:MAG: tRNA pseudouridine(38-40) synthase TruA [Acidobacteriota bacterium]